jgi:hypothetical protein
VSLSENNVNAISLIPYAFVNIDQASVSYNNERQWWEKGQKESGQAFNMNNKMKVMLKPHLWVNHNFYTGDWTSQLNGNIGNPIMKNISLILQN